MLIKKTMTTIEICEDCQKRPVEIEICYSNSDCEPLCKRCYVYALRDTINRYQDRSVGDLVEMMRVMLMAKLVNAERQPHAPDSE